MPLYVLTCHDKPGALELRMATREAHLAYVRERLQMVKLAGALLDDKGDMAGSHFILEAADIAAARAFNTDDPYTRAGLWRQVEAHPLRQAIGPF